MPDARFSKRFWVYAHDADGDLVHNYGDVDTFDQAINMMVEEILPLVEDVENLTFRIVDNEKASQTIWLAGPVKLVEESYSTKTIE